MTIAVKEALIEAKKIAEKNQNYQLDIPHLWLALLQRERFAYEFYGNLEVDMKIGACARHYSDNTLQLHNRKEGISYG